MLKYFFGARSNLVSVIRMTGIIASGGRLGSRGSLNINELSDALLKAFSLKNVKAVALIINSPGGSPVQSALISEKIRELSKEKDVPVYAFIEDLAASGGYWLSCAADEIFAMEGSIVGSIGVISSGFGAVEAIKKLGIERRVYAEGENKGMLDPFLPERTQDIKQIKKIQKDLHMQFIKWVKNRRGRRLKGTDKELFNAGIWSGADAKSLGLVDGIGNINLIMKERYGKKVKFRDFTKKVSWLKQRFSITNTSASEELMDRFFELLKERIVWSKYGF